jgi:hypothetical protein
LSIGPILVRTVRHFFPQLNDWLDGVADPRFAPFVIYDKRFLLWYGLSLFLCKLGSRRQLDYQFANDGPEVLANLNRLAQTNQDTPPVNKTLAYFLGRSGATPVAGVRTHMLRRLIRMKALDAARLQGCFVVLLDGSGYLVFGYKHCEHCLTQQHGATTLYMHQVLEAKLLGPGGMVLSLGTEFIDNRDAAGLSARATNEQRKQDCELKAARRLLAKVRQEFPQLPICLSGDNLFACGAGLQLAKDYHCSYVYVFKPGRTPALWRDFEGLLRLCPQQRVEVETPQKTKQVYRWVAKLDYEDSDKRRWQVTALHYQETTQSGEEHEWAWLSDLEVNRQRVAEVAHHGGRARWCIENQGFNVQKNSGLNLEHAYSHSVWEAFYYLLQIAHILLQLVEKGSLLQHLAAQAGKRTAVDLFGSLKNMAQRLLESLRYQRWPEEAYDVELARRIQIRLDSS